MELWLCPNCQHVIRGSLAVVLLLASAHCCESALFGRTVCVYCRESPTGLCAQHTFVLLRDGNTESAPTILLPVSAFYTRV